MRIVDLLGIDVARTVLDPLDRRVGQFHRPASLRGRLPHRVTEETLDAADPGLAPLPSFDLGLQDLQGVVPVSLDHVKPDHQGMVDRFTKGVLEVRLAPHDRHRRGGPEGDLVLPGCLVHVLGICPAVGQVLVVVDGDRPAGLDDQGRDLVEEVSPWSHLLAEWRDGIVAVFADQQHGVDGQFATAECQCRPDALEDGDLELVGHLQADVFLVNLVDVHRDDRGARCQQAVVGREATEKLADNHVGVAAREIRRGDGGHADGFFDSHRLGRCQVVGLILGHGGTPGVAGDR